MTFSRRPVMLLGCKLDLGQLAAAVVEEFLTSRTEEFLGGRRRQHFRGRRRSWPRSRRPHFSVL